MCGSDLQATAETPLLANFPLYCLPMEAPELARYRSRLQIIAVPAQQWPSSPGVEQPPWWLQYERGRLRLLRNGDQQGVCVAVEDVRRRVVRQSELAKACGLAAGQRPRLLDGTGGWGVDALCLAQLGASVTVLERLPPMWALLQDLLECSGVADVALHCADLWQWLPQQPAASFDVIYLDPMFAARKKSAAPNKRLQYLAELVTALDTPTQPLVDFEAWLQRCKPFAKARIVIKRRRHDPPLSVAPTWQVKGRSVRYDVIDPGRLPSVG